MDEKTIVIKPESGFGIFVRGLVIGAALALLFAPQTGEQTRQMISERGNDFKDKASDLVSNTRDRAQDMINDTRNKIQDTVKGVKDSMPDSNRELKRDLEIMEDVNNPNYNV